MRYRRVGHVYVEALQLTWTNWQEMCEFAGITDVPPTGTEHDLLGEKLPDEKRPGMYVPTPHGLVLATAGDYIVRDAAGVLYPCTQDVFESTYRSSFPRIVCLCGSTRFKDVFVQAGLNETLAGNIVLTIGCDMRTDVEIFGSLDEEARRDVKKRLDVLHKRKIDLADEVLILDVGGYIGESTTSELEYAREHGKHVRFWSQEA